MSISADFRHQFRTACAAAQPLQRFRPSIRIERSVFEGVFAPVKAIIDEQEMLRQFMNPDGVPLSGQINELRKMCLEAQCAHSTDDPLLKQHRAELLNALQGIVESVADSEKQNATHVTVDYDDFFKMIDRLQEIRSAAKIHDEFLKHRHVAAALFDVAEHIKIAQSNLWEPAVEKSPAKEVC